MNNPQYTIKKLTEGFMGQCMEYPDVSVFSVCEKKIDKRINIAFTGYRQLFPFKIKENHHSKLTKMEFYKHKEIEAKK